MNTIWLLEFLSASIGVDRRKLLTISDSPISPPLEPEEVEVTGLWLDSKPLEPRLLEEEEEPRLRGNFFFLPLPFGWLRFGDTTWS